jgi:hypothetical protein
MAAQYGIVKFVGAVTLKPYYRQIYTDDTNLHAIKWDGGQGALNGTDTTVFDEPVIMQDLVLAAAPAVTQFAVTRNGVSTGNQLLLAVHTAAIVSRPMLGEPFAAGQRVGLIALT